MRARSEVGRRRGAAAVGLAALACALGFACGRAVIRPAPRVPLAPAGSMRDDGSGFLARVSGGAPLGGAAAAGAAGGRTYGGAAYGGAAYGGAAYGGRTYGGSLYAGYQFRGQLQPAAPVGPYGAGYAVAPANAEAGAVHGVVFWPTPPEPLARIAPAHPGRACAGGAPNRSLLRAADGRVADTVVFLEDIKRGRALGARSPGLTQRALQVGGELEWRACELRPHVQISAPIGSVLTVATVDEPIELRSVRWDGATREAHFEVKLDAPGARRDVQLSRSGVIEVRTARAGRAWIVVAPHPYYALTDEDGRFALDEVPPGTYTLVAWHAPVVIGVDASGEPIVTAAAEARRKVVVRARQEHEVVLKLPPVR